jgi:hypothetical protein
MRTKWILSALALAVVVVVIGWLARRGREPEPAPDGRTSAESAAKREPRAWTARSVPDTTASSTCAPLPDGGFSCGACRADSDCPGGRGCFVNMETGRTECQGSECARTGECPAGMLCRVVGRTSRGEALRGCVAPGVRKTGAACDPDNAGDPNVSCDAKLLCIQGGCAQACEPPEFPDKSACPGEVPCVTTEEGSGCTPSCKFDKNCGYGKVCEFLSTEGPIALCIHRVGANCLGTNGGCPKDTDCIVETNAREERTIFSCVPRCGSGAANASCPSDSVCVPGKPTGHCRRHCTPPRGSECGAGERCKRVGGLGDLWFCSAT